jgi:malic enzyme
MVIAASKELAHFSRAKGLTETNIIPTMLDWDVFPNVAAAIGGQAQEEGLARKKLTKDEMLEKARVSMEKARNTVALLIEGGIIPRPSER